MVAQKKKPKKIAKKTSSRTLPPVDPAADPRRLPILPAPNPLPLSRTLELSEVDAHRHFGCPRYDACLARAAEAHWPSWSCAGCSDQAVRGPASEIDYAGDL